MSISHASGATLASYGPGDNWQLQTPYSLHSLGSRVCISVQPRVCSSSFSTDVMTAVTAADPWRGDIAACSPIPKQKPLLHYLRTSPPPAHSPARGPGLGLQPLCMSTLQTSALEWFMPMPWVLTQQPASPRVPVPRTAEHELCGKSAHSPDPEPRWRGQGDCAATPSPVLEAPHPTQPVSSHPLADKDRSLLKPIHKVWKR